MRRISVLLAALATICPLWSFAAPPAAATFQDYLAEHFPSDALPEQKEQNADPDGDGLSNYKEFVFGSNPLAPTAQQHREIRVKVDPETITISGTTVVGRHYELQATEFLVPTPSQSTWGTIWLAAGNGSDLSSLVLPRDNSVRSTFYRVKVTAMPSLRVDQEATGNNNGTSWQDAFTNLQDAINAAIPGQEIWIKKGLYKPTEFTPNYGWFQPRGKAFILKSGISLFGGFSGNEAHRYQRDFRSNATILSGDIESNDSDTLADLAERADNVFHVVYAVSLHEQVTLDGLTIEGGAATLPYYRDGLHSSGGGILATATSIRIANCTIRNNIAFDYGAALYVDYSESTEIIDSKFERNQVLSHAALSSNASVLYQFGIPSSYENGRGGGAICLESNLKASFTRVTFSENSAPLGGAIRLYDSVTSMNGCEFYSNVSYCGPGNTWLNDGRGGAVQASGPSCYLSIAATLFKGNTASNAGLDGNGGNGGAISFEQGSADIMTSVFCSNHADWAGGAIDSTYWATTGTELRISLSTLYSNTAAWGGGLSNYRSQVSGEGNIFYLNKNVNEYVYVSDISNTTQVNSVSSINQSVFTHEWSTNDNTSLSRYDVSSETEILFVNASDPLGPDNLWGTADDGFRLRRDFAPSAKLVQALPLDIADVDNDSDFVENLPLDASLKPFEGAPYWTGAYQGGF
jgi:hypothetical protein